MHRSRELRVIDGPPQRRHVMTKADARLIERIRMFQWQAHELAWLLRDPALPLMVAAVIRTRLREVERGTLEVAPEPTREEGFELWP